jgi:hypothetical protein
MGEFYPSGLQKTRIRPQVIQSPSAPYGANISPALNALRILPVATVVYTFVRTNDRSVPAVNPFASYHIHVNPVFSGDCALFCATARAQVFLFQQLAHSFCRHGGRYPLTATNAEGFSKLQACEIPAPYAARASGRSSPRGLRCALDKNSCQVLFVAYGEDHPEQDHYYRQRKALGSH